MKLFTTALIMISSPALGNDLIPFLQDGPKVRRSTKSAEVGARVYSFVPAIVKEIVDEQTGLVLGLEFDTSVSRAFPSWASPVAVAGEVLATYSSKMGLSNDQLGTPRTIGLTERLAVITWPLAIKNRVAVHSYVEVGLSREEGHWKARHIRRAGNIPELGSYPEGVSSDELQDLLPNTDYSIIGRRAVFWQADERFFPATFFTLRIGEEVFDVVINDVSRAIELAYSKKVSVTPLQANGYARSYLDSVMKSFVLPFTQVILGGTLYTSSGNGKIEGEGTIQSIRLANRRARIFSPGAADVHQIDSPTADGDGVLLTDANDLRAVNTYLAINRINKFVRGYISPTESDFLERSIRVTINVTGSCNAFYNGSISLYSAGNGCANMAEVNDVIFHEWGHGLDDFTGRSGGIIDGAFSEGIGDIVAAYYVGSPVMGQGFFQGSSGGIRSLLNSFRFPQDRGEVHEEGRIIGGAFWDLRGSLVERYGENKGGYLANKYFFRHLLVADTYTESYDIVLDLDDDDGNPATPSPNHCLITEAFAKHGLAQEDDCQDQVKSPLFDVGDDIQLGLLEQSSDSTLMVGAHNYQAGETLKACLGWNVTACEGDIALAPDGLSNDRTKMLYVSSRGVNLAEHQYLTAVVSKDARVVRKRIFKLVTQ